jgi:hypothetical protein
MSKLTFEALRAANASRAPRWHTSEAGMMEWTIGDWFMAMAGETGEGAEEFLPLMFILLVEKQGQLGNMAKKYRRVQEGIANKSTDPSRQIDAENAMAKMFEELADLQIYLDLFALRLREAMNTGEDIGNHVERKFNKTSEMYGFPERLIDGEFVLIDVDVPYGEQPFNELHIMGDKIIGLGPCTLKECPHPEICFKEKRCCSSGPRLPDEREDRRIVRQLETGRVTQTMETQSAEFDAVLKLCEAHYAITLTAIVDDDYPMVRGRYESAMMDLLRALKKNGRTLPPWK